MRLRVRGISVSLHTWGAHGGTVNVVLEADGGLFHIPRHGDVDVAFVLVPIDREPKVPRAFPFM